MSRLQPWVGTMLDDQTVISAWVDEQVIIGHGAAVELAFVKAMCAYAVEVIDGTLPGPYSDRTAEQYAALAL